MKLHTNSGRSGNATTNRSGSPTGRAARPVGAAAVLVLVLVSGLFLAASEAWSQSQDSNLMRRVERLQKELNDLQRYVYRGGGGATTGAGGEKVGTDVAARMQLQIGQMQEQLRSMNGRVEEIQHRITVLEQRFDRMADDLEIRLQAIEDAVARGGTVGDVAPSGAGSAAPSEAGAFAAGPSRAVTPPTPGLPEDASPREQYDFAFELLKKRDYRGAGAALEAFLDKNPDHALSGNAIYWLGETHYVQKEYKVAAKVFLDGYQKYPTGAKAPDNLLKLGMSLAAYGDKDSACKTFKKLLSTFPKAPARITRAAKGEQKKLNCS